MTESSSESEWATLGGKLRSVREYLAMSQQVVSASTGIPRSAISDIERGHRKVDSLELRKFARLYRYPVSYFLDEDDDKGPSAGDNTVSALARAVTDLTDRDRAEVLRFAEYLRFSADADRRRPQ